MNELLTILNAIYPISEQLKEYLSEKLVKKEIPKKDFILKKGRVCEEISFIEKGLVRCYHKQDVKEKEIEVTDWFMCEKDVIVSVESFFKQKPSKEYIEALEDCILYTISYADLQYAYENFIEFNFNGRVLTEKYYRLSVASSMPR